MKVIYWIFQAGTWIVGGLILLFSWVLTQLFAFIIKPIFLLGEESSTSGQYFTW